MVFLNIHLYYLSKKKKKNVEDRIYTGIVKVLVLVSDSIYLALQESAIVLVKVLLPQIFEKMEMQDLRALVAERSIMKPYLRGETIDIPHHSIGFLLEGFIKTQGVEELITSPAALLPAHGSLSFQNLETSGMKRRDHLLSSCFFIVLLFVAEV